MLRAVVAHICAADGAIAGSAGAFARAMTEERCKPQPQRLAAGGAIAGSGPGRGGKRESRGGRGRAAGGKCASAGLTGRGRGYSITAPELPDGGWVIRLDCLSHMLCWITCTM